MHNTSPVSPKHPVQQSAAFTHQADAPVEVVGPGIKRQFLGYNDELMAVRVWFDEGAEGALHNHPHSQVVFVEKGRFDVTVGEETRSLSAGDSFYVAPHVMHGAICREEGILIDMFSPVREDFLAESDIL
ncbi:MAG: cupin domain-containing protein [Pseudomonadota bacterium]